MSIPQEDSMTPLESESQVPPETASAAEPPCDRDFDLCSLAGEPVPGGDIFSGLGIPGLGAPARDPLADLLSLAPVRQKTSRDAPEDPADGATQSESESESGIVAALHAEFHRVVRDPSQLAGPAVWQGSQTSGDEEAPTLEQLQRKAQAYRLLDLMMLPRLSIEELIDTFGSLESDTLFQPHKYVDVLQLFAPEALRDRPPAIPSLTQAEHHVISIDSRIHMGGVQTRPEESP